MAFMVQELLCVSASPLILRNQRIAAACQRVPRGLLRVRLQRMGQRLGVSNEVVNGYERDATAIPDSVIATYATVTGVSPDWIRSGAGEAPPLHGEVT